MAIDNQYIPLNYLQQYFVDTVTGLPLSAGVVKFYKDSERTVEKDVYKLNGYPTYSYESLGNELTLGHAGTFIDESGNDISVFAYPYDTSGNVELYYVTIDSADGLMPTDTRSGVPYIASDGASSTALTNYVPNGQFAIHNNVHDDSLSTLSGRTYVTGLIKNASTQIAPGGWSFERDAKTTAIDYVTFDSFNGYVPNPKGCPRFSCHIKCTQADSSGSVKALRLKFPDVNKFYSLTELYTWGIFAISNSGGSIPAHMYLHKDFGTGGSTATDHLIQDVTIATSYTAYYKEFVFGDNSLIATIVPGTDFVSLDLWLPPASTFDVSITCVALVPGKETLTNFPTETDADTKYKSIAGWATTPDPNGNDLYCPMVLTQQGMAFDHSFIGLIYDAAYETVIAPYLFMNGQCMETSTYSSLGIPYSRLMNALYVASECNTRWGAGGQYFVVSNSTYPSILFTATEAGTITAPADGTIKTNFVFDAVSGSPQHFKCTCVAASAMAGTGCYFIFYATDGSKYVVWFKIGSTGTQPVVSGTYKYIEVDIASTATAIEVATATRIAVNTAYYVLADIRGRFKRMWANGQATDPDRASRMGSIWYPGMKDGDEVGTFQDDDFYSHDHSATTNMGTGLGGGGGTSNFAGGAYALVTPTVTVAAKGGHETRPKNIYVMPVIRY